MAKGIKCSISLVSATHRAGGAYIAASDLLGVLQCVGTRRGTANKGVGYPKFLAESDAVPYTRFDVWWPMFRCQFSVVVTRWP